MEQLIIDRFENGFAICEQLIEGKKPKKKKELHYFGIPKEELPEGAREGSVLVIAGDGTLQLDNTATKARREKIRSLEDKLFE